jgi:uncharacterized protein YdaU (DUF1376 family)
MPFFPEKFFADTLHLSWDARAVYLELLAIAWNRGGSLPDDQDKLRLMIGCYSKAWGRVWREIAPFWAVGEDGQLHQKRLDKEWQRVVARHPRLASQIPTNGAKRQNPDGKKPNDYSRAPARESHTHTHKEEEEARDARTHALTRGAPSGFKNGKGRGARYGQNRKPTLADIVDADIARLEAIEREQSELVPRIEGGTSGEDYLGPVPAVRH